jgi:uncharacterized damage-inducible protein DinB
MKRTVSCLAVVLAASACAPAPAPSAPQAPPSTAIRDSLKSAADLVVGNISKAADQVPENLYTFKATPDVRSLGQLFAHVADASYMICGAVSGEAVPEGSVEQTKTAKADIQQALADATAFCERAFDSVNDVTGADAVTLFGAMNTTRLGALAFNNAHNMEHYGNIVTYMRLNKLVPPSSQQ